MLYFVDMDAYTVSNNWRFASLSVSSVYSTKTNSQALNETHNKNPRARKIAFLIRGFLFSCAVASKILKLELGEL